MAKIIRKVTFRSGKIIGVGIQNEDKLWKFRISKLVPRDVLSQNPQADTWFYPEELQGVARIAEAHHDKYFDETVEDTTFGEPIVTNEVDSDAAE